MLCFKNGVAVDQVSVLDRAFQYGDGCFTTAFVRKNKIQLWSRHLARLRKASLQLMLNFDEAVLYKTFDLLFLNQHLQGTLKIVISRGEGKRGYNFSLEKVADVYVFYFPNDMAPTLYSEIERSCVLQKKIGLTMPHLVGIKSLNRLEQVILKKEAVQAGVSEALVLDIQDQIVEGVSSNCFLLLNEQWITPDLRYNGVHGIMRAEILDRMKNAHILCQARQVYEHEVVDIKALFFCNALHPMQAVQTLNDRCLDIHVTKQLFQMLKLDQM